MRPMHLGALSPSVWAFHVRKNNKYINSRVLWSPALKCSTFEEKSEFSHTSWCLSACLAPRRFALNQNTYFDTFFHALNYHDEFLIILTSLIHYLIDFQDGFSYTYQLYWISPLKSIEDAIFHNHTIPTQPHAKLLKTCYKYWFTYIHHGFIELIKVIM